MRSTVLAMLGCWMALAGSAATAKEPVLIEPEFPWTASGVLQLPPLQPDVPAAAAGCVVVGHHILADGTTAKLRIMQGAFTDDVATRAQADFQRAVLEYAHLWRFQPVQPGDKPSATFNMVVVGFGVASALEGSRVVVGIDGQDARLRQACSIELSEWGNRNAIPVDEAAAREDEGMLIAQPDDPSSYWVGAMRPGRYPVGAARLGVEACVVIGFRIGVDGVPGDFRIMYSSLKRTQLDGPLKQFEQSSLLAASAWRFAPGPDNLQRLPMFRQTPMSFHLGPGKKAPFACKAVDLAGSGTRAANGG